MKRILIAVVSVICALLLGVFWGKLSFFTRKDALMNNQNIHTVTAAGDLEATRRLLDQGVSANERDGLLQTPLLHAAWWGHGDVVKILLEHGADVNAQSTLGFTGLYWAVNHGHYDIAEMLLKAGAKTNVYSLNDWTPLHEAAVLGNDHMYQLLVQYGAKEDALDCWGKAPRMLREQKKHAY